MIKYDSSRLKISSFFILLTSIITLIFSFSAYSHWTRINIGGGGAFNSVSVGKAGTIIANSDIVETYIEPTRLLKAVFGNDRNAVHELRRSKEFRNMKRKLRRWEENREAKNVD